MLTPEEGPLAKAPTLAQGEGAKLKKAAMCCKAHWEALGKLHPGLTGKKLAKQRSHKLLSMAVGGLKQPLRSQCHLAHAPGSHF